MGKRIACITIIAMIALSSIAGIAQEAEPDVEFNYGVVVQVMADANKVTVKEYDWDTDEEIEIVYTVHPEAELVNMDSIKGLKPDTDIDFEYIIDAKGDRVIKYISVYETETSD